MSSKISTSIRNLFTTIQSITTKHWKYIAFYLLGSTVSLLFSFNIAYKWSGFENGKQFLFAIYLKYESQKYNKATSDWRLSKYIAIRPSSVLCALDQFYFNFIRAGMDPIKRQKYINKSIKDKINEFKRLTVHKTNYDINHTLLPFGSNRILIDKYIKEIKINGFHSLKINYPGTECIKDNINIIIAFHGGSNCGGAPQHFRSFLVLLSQLTVSTCYSMGYGLAPQYIMPSQVDHVINAYHYILKEYKSNGININKVFIVGHSAGSNIVLLALQRMNKDKNMRYPDGAIVIGANVDRSLSGEYSETFITNNDRDCAIDREMFMEMEQFVVGNLDIDGKWKSKKDEISLKDPSLSPLFGQVKGLCDLYVFVGLNECLLSQNQEFIAKCKANNVDVEYEFNEWLPHNGPLLCDSVPEARDSVVRMSQWIKKRMVAKYQLI